jgi:hypothetical protein
MEDYITLSNKLEELRIDILNYKNSDDEKQDLMGKFFEVKKVSPETYELFVLIYNEFNMTNKSDKKQMLILLDKALTIKSTTVNKMINERKKYLPWTQRLYEMLTWENAKRVLFTWVVIVMVLVTIYEIDPGAYRAINESLIRVINETADVIKETK